MKRNESPDHGDEDLDEFVDINVIPKRNFTKTDVNTLIFEKKSPTKKKIQSPIDRRISRGQISK